MTKTNDNLVKSLTPKSYTDIYLHVYGWVSTGATELKLCTTMVLTKNIKQISVTKILVAVRLPTGGYIAGGNYVDLTKYLSKATIEANSEISMSLINRDGWGVTNNIPLIGAIRVDFQLI